MTGRGKGGAKRHRKVLRDNIQVNIYSVPNYHYNRVPHCPPNRPVKACVLTKPLPAAPDCPTKRRALNNSFETL